MQERLPKRALLRCYLGFYEPPTNAISLEADHCSIFCPSKQLASDRETDPACSRRQDGALPRRHSPLMLLGCVIAMAIIYSAPPVLAAFAHGLSQAFGALAWLMMAASLQPTLQRYGRSPLWGLVLPLVALFYMCATVASAARFRLGRGGGWKDRVYREDRGK